MTRLAFHKEHRAGVEGPRRSSSHRTRVMPQTRPLERLEVPELQDMAFTHWTSQRKLREIERELSLRSSPAEIDLCEEIRDRLATFFDAGGGEPRDADGSDSAESVRTPHEPLLTRARHRVSLIRTKAKAASVGLVVANAQRLRRAAAACRKAVRGASNWRSALARAARTCSEVIGNPVPSGARAGLETEVAEARQRIAVLEQHRADLEGELSRARQRIARLEQQAAGFDEGGLPLLRRLGLDEKCPDFVIKAARTAYRKTFHPDTQPAHRRAEAERRFKETEAVFEAVYASRGIRA
jgi:hypothetical protein